MEERAVASLARFIKTIDQARGVFPPLKKLLFEAFWFVFAVVEIFRFLWSLF